MEAAHLHPVPDPSPYGYDPETAKWCSTCGSDDPGFDRHAPDGLHPMESCPDPFHFDTTQPGNQGRE